MRIHRGGTQRGQVVILVTFALVVLIGTVGLAIDSGVGYLVKAKLNAAVDSAVIAAARTVSQGSTPEQQRTNAIQAARAFFDANYPVGYMGSSAILSDPSIVFDDGKVVLDASARATMPTTFMRVFDVGSFDVLANAQAVRKDVDMALVIDTTGSMNTGTVPEQVKSNTKLFLTKFNQTLDRVALIQYAYGAVIRDGFVSGARGFDINAMNGHVDNFTFAGSTNSSEGLWHARNQLNNAIPVGAARACGSSSFFPMARLIRLRRSSHSMPVPAPVPAQGRFPPVIPRHRIGLPGSGRSTPSTLPLPRRAGKMRRSPTRARRRIFLGCLIGTTPTIPPMRRRCVNFRSSSTFLDRYQRYKHTRQCLAKCNRAARNLLESMAEKSRSEGIYVFTLGLGNQLTVPAGPDGEKGEDILKCMANVADAPNRCVTIDQPVGTYCHAATENELKPCFDKLASAILRLTK